MSISIAVASRRRLWVVLALLVAWSVCLPGGADPLGPRPEDHNITVAVLPLLRTEHLSGHPLDDEISQRCVHTFLKSLDPMKVYFYQSDVDRFMQWKNELDDLATSGKIDQFVSFGYMVFRVFLERVDERVAFVDELLSMEHDFTVDEQMVRDPDVAQYARNKDEAWEKWRKRIKYDLLMLKADEIEGQEAVEKLSRRYHSFAKRMHQMESEELLEMYLTAMTTAFDPHTTYMSPSTAETFGINMSLKFDGIGAALRWVDGYTVVQEIIRDGAADKDGRLQVEDKIVGVGEGADGEIVSVVDLNLSRVVKMIRGKRGTVVRLEVISGASGERKIIDITRAKIELKDSEAQAEIFEEGQKPDGRPYKIGVIDLPSFYMDMEANRRGDPNYKSCTRDVRRILEDFNAQGVDAVVLDLRRNGGGALQEAISLTGLFIKSGPIVQVKDFSGRVRPYDDPDPDIVWKGPLVVLTSKLSASASEILAGAIQDYNRGLIVGDPATHGKGTVQSLTDLRQRLLGSLWGAKAMGALKITMQQFYRPSGDSTQNRGVLADVVLPSLTAHLDIAEADLDYAMGFDHVQPLRFERLSYIDQTIRDRLNQLSAGRRRNSEEFQKVLRNIARYLEQKERKYVPLNEEKFMAEREELNADKEEQKELEKINGRRESGIKRDYYLDEALAITLDYLQMTLLAKAN